MEKVIWLVITIPCSLLFTGIGIYAWRRTKPMWFWSGSSVREDEITNVKAYNNHVDLLFRCFLDQYNYGYPECFDCRDCSCSGMPGRSSTPCYSLQQDLQEI